MPDFYPSILENREIKVSPENQVDFIHIQFFAIFPVGSPIPDGKWQIWTDIPFVNDDQPVNDGEWRERDFGILTRPSEAPKSSSNLDKSSSGAVITIPATKLLSKPEPPILGLTLVVPTSCVGRTYSYTFRHIDPSGAIQWFSEMGVNGIINIKRISSAQKQVIQSSPNYHSGLYDSHWELECVAITLPDGEHSTQLGVHTLPAEDCTSPTLILAHNSLYSRPLSFYQFSPTKFPLPPKSSFSFLTIIGHLDNPLKMSGKKPLGCKFNGYPAGFAFGVDVSPSKVFKQAVQITQGDHSHLVVSDVREGDKTSEDVVAFFHFSGSEKAIHTYLVVDALRTVHSRDITVSIPDRFSSLVPLAVNSENMSFPFCIPSSIGDASRNVPFHVEPGEAIAAFRLAAFTKVSGMNNDDSLWVYAPEALSIEVGHYEDRKERNLPVQYLSVPNVSNCTRSIDTDETKTQISIDSSDDKKKESSGGCWIFYTISRLLFNIWNVLTWPFRSKQKPIQSASIPEENNLSSTNEQTPLLGYRDSPTFEITQTPANNSSNASCKPVRVPNTSLSRTVPITSFAKLTFSQSPPFKLYFPPSKEDFLENILFILKNEQSEEWQEAATIVARRDCIVEVVIDTDDTRAGQKWQIQIERK
nr:hypothetical protein L203_01787 [Cryptococcus depauperatus CBS 7841]